MKFFSAKVVSLALFTTGWAKADGIQPISNGSVSVDNKAAFLDQLVSQLTVPELGENYKCAELK